MISLKCALYKKKDQIYRYRIENKIEVTEAEWGQREMLRSKGTKIADM